MINVHFTSAALAAALRGRGAEAMLYFVYAPDVIGVVVAHNLGTGEFALQIPSFGPPLSPEELGVRFTPQHCAKLVRLATVGSGGESTAPEVADIDVLSVAGWTMRAAVAQRWVAGDAILCGDAAHVFPPAGGFGMNTGIQDAHALAWRLAVLHGSGDSDSASSELLAGYERERRQIAEANSALSIRNYYGVAELSAELGCNPAHAELAASVASTVLPPQIFGSGFARGLVESTVALAAQGVLSEKSLQSSLALGPSRVAAASARIESGSTLRLHFPAEDLGFCYEAAQQTQQHEQTRVTSGAGGAGAQVGGEYRPQTVEGARLPLFHVLPLSDSCDSKGRAGEGGEDEPCWSLDVVGDAVGSPKMTLFVPADGLIGERWRAEAVGAAWESVELREVDSAAWEHLQGLDPAGEALGALLVRPDGHILRRFSKIDDAEGMLDEGRLLEAAVRGALGGRGVAVQ